GADAQALHPVLRATQAHYRLTSIHPFRDGNGRTARLLMNLFLLRAGYPIAVIDCAKRSAYIDSLVYTPHHEDDIGPLFLLVAGACRESLTEYLATLSTAESSRGSGRTFYSEIIKYFPS